MSVEGQTFPKSVQPGIPRLGLTPKGWKRYRIGDLFDVVSRPTDLHDNQEYDLVTVNPVYSSKSMGAGCVRLKAP
jgi:type I restriction enzyme, S subunit